MTKKLTALILLFFIAVSVFDCDAKVFGKKAQEEIDIFELTLDENISLPELGKQAKAICVFQDEQLKSINKLIEKGQPYEVRTIRDGEVLMVTIPARHLFKQNETVLTDKGKELLKPFLKYLKTQRLYKMALAMHSDNTGNDIYTEDLTTKRVNSIADWIGENNVNTDYVVPYAMGSNDPIVDNNSVANRDKNRRLVIYLIPDKTMITQAKRSKITL